MHLLTIFFFVVVLLRIFVIFFFHILFFVGDFPLFPIFRFSIYISFLAEHFSDIFVFYIIFLFQDFPGISFCDTVFLTLGLYNISLSFHFLLCSLILFFSDDTFFFLLLFNTLLIVLFVFSVHFSFKNCTWK